jgi:rod shape-determining protein MreD
MWETFASVDLFGMDLLTIMIAYLFLLYGGTIAGTFAFGQGFLIDLLSGGLDGLFALLYLSVFGGIYLGCRFFNLQDPKGQIIIVFLAVLLKGTVFFIVLKAFSPQVVFSKSYVYSTGASAICAGLIAPMLFGLFNRIQTISLNGERGFPSDELQALDGLWVLARTPPKKTDKT